MQLRKFIQENKNPISTLVFLLLVSVYIANNQRNFEQLFDLKLIYLLPIFIGYLLTSLSNGLFLKLILEPYKKLIPINEAVFVSILSSIGNYFAPAGTGFGIRAVYLRKKHGLKYSLFLSTLAGNYLLVFLVNSFAGLVSLAFLSRYSSMFQYKVLFVGLLMIFLFSLLSILLTSPIGLLRRYTRLRHLGTIIHRAIDVLDGWHQISRNRKLIIKLLLLISFNLSLSVLITFSIIHSLGLVIGFIELILLSVIGAFSLFVNITPGNIGIKEGLYIFLGTIIGLSINDVILIALIDRATLLISLVVLWISTNRKRDDLKKVLSPEEMI